MDAIELRRLGAEILNPVLTPHGFMYEAGVADRGSGGSFARGAFVRGDRRLEFSARYALGEVFYRIGVQALSHEAYMRVAAGAGKHRYPGFSDDPLDGFRDLAADLAAFGVVFLTGESTGFAAIAEEAERSRPPLGFRALSKPPAS
jgi:hypothetical protein